MRKPKVKLNHSIDLHHKSVQQGYNLALMHVRMAYNMHRKSVRIITGRSGQMNKEAQRWFKNPSFKQYVEHVYHDFHKGSWFVELKTK